MEEQNSHNEQRPGITTVLTGGLVRDYTDGQGAEHTYTRCKNGTSVLPDGQKGTGRHTEPATLAETVVPYTLIGRIPLHGDIWWLFSTNNTISEIGEYNESTGSYITKLNDTITLAAGLPGMGFKTTHLITGAARRNFDCGFDVYWSDSLNPDRMVDTQYKYPDPWVQNCTTIAACITCVDTDKIDIEQLRLSPQFSVPCLQLSKSTGSGTLLNGSYQVALRFAINSIPCTDFVALSNIQAIFAHNNSAGAVVLSISGINTETTVIFPEIEIVVVSMVNFQVQAKRLGIYSSSQQTIYIDNLDQELQNIDIKLLPVSNPIIDKSDAIYAVSSYLTRVGTYEKPEFNYQPLANNIIAKWACIEYPDDYYHKGGNNGFPMNVGHMRGERYAYFIRWVYTTGDKSASYHIPGLPSGTPATLSIGGPSTGDGGVTIASGRFAGYSSTERYPDNKPLVYGPLCGQFIMHHQFPDQATFGGTVLSHYYNHGSSLNPDMRIRVMGVYFDNIQPPVDINGVVIPNIQGYEILRAVRNGHEHILAKGQINNMRTYIDSGGSFGMFQNYPYNDLNPDKYLTDRVASIDKGVVGDGYDGHPLTTYSNRHFSFHSPDTVFEQPYLGNGQLDVVMGMNGNSHGQFQVPYKHPMFKVLTDFDSYLTGIVSGLVVFINVLNAFSGGATNLTLAATEDIPFTSPLGVTSMPDGLVAGTSTISTVEYFALSAANIILAALLAGLELAIINQQLSNVIKGLIPARQYAAQYNSSGWYNIPTPLQGGAISTSIDDYSYIKGQMQSFDGFTINNLYRNRYTAIKLSNNIPAYLGDNSRYLLTDVGNSFNWDSSHGIASYYAAYTVAQNAQYGQIDSAKQVPISCMQGISPVAGTTYTSGVLFGGDTYINRYTEKNPFFFFNDWLVNAPTDFLYDYRNYINVPYPMFWIDNDVNTNTLLGLAHTNRRLNGPVNASLFFVKTGYFYLFCNGVRDFYVESSVNVGYRDTGDTIPEMFYDPYGFQDVNQMFRSDIIKSDAIYKYDYSLSADRFINQYLSWGKCLDRDYDPILAYTCNNYYPRRLIYSLPQEEELKKDNWKVFLPNNYEDFPTRITAIKDAKQSGALILLQDQSPLILPGVLSIPSTNGGDFVTGSGQLFKQALQSMVNVDESLQFGSCQNRLAVVSTPYGTVWCSQNTGKIFQSMGGKPIDISEKGLKYDLSLYMPSQLLKQYPDYPLYDNPVHGIGMQLIYDNTNSILYICKKDYKLKSQYLSRFILSGDTFIDNLYKVPVTVGDPLYFDNCCWTLSHDMERQQFISHHDWIPSLNIPTKTHPVTTNGFSGTLWRHNKVTDLFCNYYGVDYHFEIEYPVTTGFNVTTLNNIEVYLESYNYKANQVDRFHEYNGFFNECLIYNSEQATPLMIMNLKPWDDPYNTAGYPFFSSLGINTYYTKQEQKYRIAMGLRDYTLDRFQFGLGAVQLLQTQPNWMDFQLNNLYYDFNKPWNQLKQIRHFKCKVFLRKTIVGNNSMSFYFSRSNNQNSSR